MVIRCEHCQRDSYILDIVTLYGYAGGHPREEEVFVCLNCVRDPNHVPSYWYGWIDSFLGNSLEDLK